MTRAALRFFAFAALALSAAGCGPSAGAQRRTLARVRAAIGVTVSTPVILAEHNQLVRDLVDSGALERMNRAEVEAALGPASRCATNVFCERAGFEQEDVFYEVGQNPEETGTHVPLVFIGFDTAGRVVRTSYLTPE